jgi:hypothetical protein
LLDVDTRDKAALSLSGSTLTNIITDTRGLNIYIQMVNKNGDNIEYLDVIYNQSYSSSLGKITIPLSIPDKTYTAINIKHNGQAKDLFFAVVDSSYVGDMVLSFDLLNNDTSTVGGVQIKDMQLEIGTVATSYAPYSNICPITGFTGTEVTVTGKNLYNPSTCENGFIAAATGLVVGPGDPTYKHSDYIRVKPNTQYAVKGFGWYGANSGAYYDKYENYIDGITYPNDNGCVITTPSDAYYVRLSINPAISQNPQFEEGSAVTDYEPYKGNVYSITFPSEAGTVYGGTLTIDQSGAGTLVVDRAKVNAKDLTWPTNGTTSTSFEMITYQLTNKAHGMSNMISDKMATHPADAQYVITGRSNSVNVSMDVPIATISSADAFNTWLNTENPIIVYELATPVTYQLDSVQVRTLLGVNNIWADTGNVKKLVYPADTKLYIDEQIAAVAALASS